MLAVWVEQLLGFASGALKAIRQDERYPTLMAWARDEGPALVGGDLSLAQALAPELWSQTPLARLGEPEDIARAVAFLACEAPFITGQVIVVDGGRGLAG